MGSAALPAAPQLGLPARRSRHIHAARHPAFLNLSLLPCSKRIQRRWNFDASKGPVHCSWFNGAETSMVRVQGVPG